MCTNAVKYSMKKTIVFWGSENGKQKIYENKKGFPPLDMSYDNI